MCIIIIISGASDIGWEVGGAPDQHILDLIRVDQALSDRSYPADPDQGCSAQSKLQHMIIDVF
jgi:hypothetical protein